MSWSLVRVDDRLIHGQVVVAWGRHLRPKRIWVADDATAASSWERDLLASAAPGVEVKVVTVAEAAAGFAEEAVTPGGAFLLVRNLATALALHRAGATFTSLNLGGIHYATGRTKVNEFVYLGPEDRAQARELIRDGVRLVLQDVPATRPVTLSELEPELDRT